MDNLCSERKDSKIEADVLDLYEKLNESCHWWQVLVVGDVTRTLIGEFASPIGAG